ncbi:hypothetical protein KQH60_09385 [Mycetohabitans sp. B8]|uniref:hypothetical protein n=1 Tax=Mycetohabitans sp. B8 TaxID=2841845 RepID=UPI001F223076|nr:hypothetical protein [Mycetohabitans sp. B8]MCG1042738.1 hypothetical protein [Mycetohabitans sp. B8]
MADTASPLMPALGKDKDGIGLPREHIAAEHVSARREHGMYRWNSPRRTHVKPDTGTC